MALGSYGGDVGVADVWPRLRDDPSTLLVDVRTRAEWSFVGLPDLGSIGKQPILIEWQSYPSMAINDAFVPTLEAEVERRGLSRDVPIFFLCRSGGRSQGAAMAATGHGFTAAYNVAGGFEGPVDADGHRGTVLGWKAAGLPWSPS